MKNNHPNRSRRRYCIAATGHNGDTYYFWKGPNKDPGVPGWVMGWIIAQARPSATVYNKATSIKDLAFVKAKYAKEYTAFTLEEIKL